MFVVVPLRLHISYNPIEKDIWKTVVQYKRNLYNRELAVRFFSVAHWEDLLTWLESFIYFKNVATGLISNYQIIQTVKGKLWDKIFFLDGWVRPTGLYLPTVPLLINNSWQTHTVLKRTAQTEGRVLGPVLTRTVMTSGMLSCSGGWRGRSGWVVGSMELISSRVELLGWTPSSIRLWFSATTLPGKQQQQTEHRHRLIDLLLTIYAILITSRHER